MYTKINNLSEFYLQNTCFDKLPVSQNVWLDTIIFFGLNNTGVMVKLLITLNSTDILDLLESYGVIARHLLDS